MMQLIPMKLKQNPTIKLSQPETFIFWKHGQTVRLHRTGRPMTFLWPMETTSPWASCDVFMADGNHFAMGVL